MKRSMLKSVLATVAVSGVTITSISGAYAAQPAWVNKVVNKIHRMVKMDQPRIPHRIFNITSFGAVGNGTTMNTKAIEKTVNACEKAGGGEVLIPAGKYLTGPLVLGSNMNFHVARGAEILMSTNPKNYIPAANQRNIEHPGYRNCIVALHAHDIAITGHGTIDGQGQAWWPRYRKQPGHKHPPKLPHRPFMVVLENCTRVLVKNVHLENSPMFHLVPNACRDVIIDHVTITAPINTPNTDACDPAGWNYYITRCTFNEGDDCIAIKAGARNGTPAHPSCENFLITHCTFEHGHGMSVGGQTNGCLKYVVVRDCTFDHTHRGVRLKAGPGYGGLSEYLWYQNLTMRNVRLPVFINSFYPKKPKTPSLVPPLRTHRNLPVWKHVYFENITSVNSPHAGRISALPGLPADDIVFSNVHIHANRGFTMLNARNIRFENSSITVRHGPAIIPYNAQVTGINIKTGQPK
ncbi:MAG: glycoside hydrolase family 28 protein [Phycisphaerae bacterium]